MKMAINLIAKAREDLTRGATRQIRQDGFIQAVVYEKDKEARTVSVQYMELLKTVSDEGRNAIISLDIEDASKVDVMLHEYQTDPVKGEVIHADLDRKSVV